MPVKGESEATEPEHSFSVLDVQWVPQPHQSTNKKSDLSISNVGGALTKYNKQ
jgi:hypothetical protein